MCYSMHTEDIAEERYGWFVRTERGLYTSGLEMLESIGASLDGGGDGGAACFAGRVMSGLRRFAPRPRTAVR